jgi:hypothetical protein
MHAIRIIVTLLGTVHGVWVEWIRKKEDSIAKRPGMVLIILRLATSVFRDYYRRYSTPGPVRPSLHLQPSCSLCDIPKLLSASLVRTPSSSV